MRLEAICYANLLLDMDLCLLTTVKQLYSMGKSALAGVILDTLTIRQNPKTNERTKKSDKHNKNKPQVWMLVA